MISSLLVGSVSLWRKCLKMEESTASFSSSWGDQCLPWSDESETWNFLCMLIYDFMHNIRLKNPNEKEIKGIACVHCTKPAFVFALRHCRAGAPCEAVWMCHCTEYYFFLPCMAKTWTQQLIPASLHSHPWKTILATSPNPSCPFMQCHFYYLFVFLVYFSPSFFKIKTQRHNNAAYFK